MSNRKADFKSLLKRFRWTPLVVAGALLSLLMPVPGTAKNQTVPEGIGTHSGGVCAAGATTAAVLLGTPGAPTVAPVPAPVPAPPVGTTLATWSYEVVAYNSHGQGIPSPANANTLFGYTNLSAATYNHITWAPVANALGYVVLRTAVVGGTPSTTGQIGLPVPAGGTLALDDIGLTAAPPTPPATVNPVAVPSTSSFVLTATKGYISTPDGNAIFMWGYANGNGAFQYPGPILCVNEGDNVTITLKNSLPVATSLIFPGVTKVNVDGQTMSLEGATDSFAKAAPSGAAVTYTFPAGDPGTYLYESGTNPELQDRMGMMGALIVRPALAASFSNYMAGTAANPCPSVPVLSDPALKSHNSTLAVGFVYDNCSSAFNAGTEFMHLLSEVDPHMHHAIELETCQTLLQASNTGGTVTTDATGLMTWSNGANTISCRPDPNPSYDMTKYLPRYFFINGRSFPDTITPNYNSSIPTQPYGALVHVLPNNLDGTSGDYNPLPAAVRFLGGGPVNYPFHPHSNHDESIGVDGRMLVNSLGALNSIDRFGYVIPPGQTSEALFSWTDAQKWDPQANPIGVPEPGAQNRADGAYWSGSPYLGQLLPLLNGITQWNQCGEYYHFAHSHDLVHVTNYGSPGGGMLTLIRVDPPPSLQTRYGTNCAGGPGWN